MEDILFIPALLRLLDFASIRKYNLKDKQVKFDDEIGRKAILINNKLKSSKGLDIFDRNLKLDEISSYEHLIGNAMSNHVNKKVVLRKVNDEIKVLKEAKIIDPKKLKESSLEFSTGIIDTIKDITSIKSEDLLQIILNTEYLSLLPGSNLKEQYFAASSIILKGVNYFLVSVISHESGKQENLFVTNFFILEQEKYMKFHGNPVQLFLKGLDKYGVDMNINDTLSRYYYWVELPLSTNIQSIEFLNLKNLAPKEPFALSMVMRRTIKSIEIQNVFATNLSSILKKS